MSTDSAKRVLILIVAYNAEKTIRDVLGRIPIRALPLETEVLLIDDSSSDKTFDTACSNRDLLGEIKITVLSNAESKGYGGNQKIGYQYAIEKGFDVIALLHGDGQYAPEKLPDLLKSVISGEADACLGSRIMERGAALKDGMPVYKYVGNRVLTTVQNRLLGMNLTEFHSGYRVYSVSALKQLPFEYNTDDFHFDTEIIIQFAMKGFRIKEVPIPTYYGDEIRYVNGLAYAWNVVKTTLASRIHRMGILFCRKYDIYQEESLYDIKLGYESSHTLAISAVRAGSHVLDLACGPGLIARELRRKGCHVIGIDKQPVRHDAFNRFFLHDLDSPELPVDLGQYEYILVLDSIEHLDFPEKLLENLKTRCFSEKAKVILTTPNIGFFVTRIALFVGQFNYGRLGILDLTHKRLYTFGSFRRLLQEEGYKIVALRGIPAPFPKAIGNNRLSRMLLRINRFLIAVWPSMFSYQIYVEATFLPPLDQLLARTFDATAARLDHDLEQSMD